MENLENPSNFSSFDNTVQTPPSNNMVLAIIGAIVGLCSPCCILGLIPGVIAIIMSAQVNSKFNAGDYAGAESSAKYAKILAFVAIGLGIIGIIYSIIQIQMHGGIDGYMEMIEDYQRQMGG